MALSLLSVASGLLLTPSAVRTPSNIMMTATLEPKAAAGATGSSTVEKTVMKFGGSSVRDAERITEVCNIITSRIELGEKPHAVCSAMGKTTNNLLAAADMAIAEGKVDISVIRQLHADTADTLGLNDSPAYKEVVSLLDELERTLEGVAMLGELSRRTRDRIVSYGERMSGRMVAASLEKNHGTPAKQYESWDLGLVTTSRFGDAEIEEESWAAMKAGIDKIPKDTVGIITGFIGKDSKGRITTLGRGGSDLTASFIGAAAGYDEVQVWKDVDGILSADPRVCPNAQVASEVSFEEAAELAYFGAQVLHPVAMQPAMRVNIPVRVKNSYNTEAPGTVISEAKPSQRPSGCDLVSAITSKSNVAMVDIVSTRMLGDYGFLAQVFDSFKRNKLSVNVVATSEVSVSLTLNKAIDVLSKVQSGPLNMKWAETQDIEDVGLRSVIEDLSDVSDITVTPDRAIITLIANVEQSSAVMATVFGVLKELGVQVEMLSQGASKVNISFIIPGDKEKDAVKALHACFFEDTCLVPMEECEA